MLFDHGFFKNKGFIEPKGSRWVGRFKKWVDGWAEEWVDGGMGGMGGQRDGWVGGFKEWVDRWV